MPQISLYLDTETLEKIEKAAELDNISISKWVTGKLIEHLKKIALRTIKVYTTQLTTTAFAPKRLRISHMIQA